MTDKIKKANDNKLLNQLISAIIGGNTKLIKQILKHKIDLNQSDKSGNTPLMLAIDYGNATVAELLIKAGADVNIVNKKGNNPLMEAISKQNYPNRYAMVKMLLRNGADANYIGQFGRTPLYLCKLYQPRYIDILRRYGAVC